MAETITPGTAWATLTEGNARFAAGEAGHPHQGLDRRVELVGGQSPVAAIVGCADSRVSPEVLFDLGLGDLFVMRNAGQVVGTTVLGSLEYAVAHLDVPLIVVLGHSACGAVAAAIAAVGPDSSPQSFQLQKVVDRIVPAVSRAEAVVAEGGSDSDALDPAVVGRLHVEASVGAVLEQSILISEAVAGGRLAVVGANYDLATGSVEAHTVIGTL